MNEELELQQNAEMQEEVATPRKSRIRESLESKYPDLDVENDEEWGDLEDEYFDEMVQENSLFREAEGKLKEIISMDEELAEVLNDMIVNKTPFRVAIAKFYSEEDLIPLDGDEDYEEYERVYNEKLEKNKQRQQRDSELQTNEDAALATIEEYAAEKNYGDEQKRLLVDFINDIFDNLLMKKITKDMLVAFDNARNHDADVDRAREAGEIKGRNAKIQAEIEDEEEDEMGDGIPYLDKGGNMQPQKKVKDPLFDDIIGKRKTI